MSLTLNLIGWMAAILGFGLLVLAHEFGHFWALRKRGQNVYAFSIGFGTPIWKFSRGGVQYRIGWIPLGGYVMLEDPQVIEKREAEGKDLFDGGSPITQLIVAFMGPVANLLLAWLLFTVVICGWGEPNPVPIVESVVNGSPSDSAGLQPLDRLVKLNGLEISSWNDLIEKIQINKTGNGILEIDRNGKNISIAVSPKLEGDRFVLGIRPQIRSKSPLPVHAAIIAGINRTMEETLAVSLGIIRFFSFSTSGQISGPIAILDQVSRSAMGGWVAFLSLLAILSVNLAVFNLLPIPPLDGVRILFAFWNLIFGKPIREKLVVSFYQWGALGLALVFVLVTLKDLTAFFL